MQTSVARSFRVDGGDELDQLRPRRRFAKIERNFIETETFTERRVGLSEARGNVPKDIPGFDFNDASRDYARGIFPRRHRRDFILTRDPMKARSADRRLICAKIGRIRCAGRREVRVDRYIISVLFAESRGSIDLLCILKTRRVFRGYLRSKGRRFIRVNTPPAELSPLYTSVAC